jgi:predicted acetyltransferase
MATEIRALRDDELAEFVRVGRAAYPGGVLSADELLDRLRRSAGERDPAITQVGAFRDGALVGIMRYYDFTMSYHGTMLPVGGVGFVAVDLLHKKEHVARDLIGAYLRHYRDGGAPLAALYPFRPDFYRRMGFGYGSRLNAYKFATAGFPPGPRDRLRHLTRDDLAATLACHNRYVARTHGLFVRGEGLMLRTLEAPDRRAVGYVEDGEVRGYLIYQFQRGVNFIDNTLEVVELVAERPAALRQLCAFIHTQADQVARVAWNTHDDQLHHLVVDPRDGTGNLLHPVSHQTNTQGSGIMYRLLDTAGFFRAVAGHDFGGESLTLAIDVRDSFLPENQGEVVVRFEGGRPTLAPDARPDARLTIAVEYLSPLLMGSAELGSLLAGGLAEIDEPGYSGRVRRLFRSEARPACMTAF